MMATVTLMPKAAAEQVCHDEQLVVWSSDFAGALSIGGFVRDDLDYDGVLELHETIKQELRRVIESAFSHPECQTVRRI